MVECDSEWPLGPKLSMVRRVFKCDVLKILLSDFDDGLKEHTSCTKERSCVRTMSVVIMRTAHN